MTTHPTLSRRALMGGGLASLALASCGTSARGGAEHVLFYESKPEAIPYFSRLAAAFTRSQSDYWVQHDIATNLSASFVRSSPPDLGCLNLDPPAG
ncbi:hypothetical protein JSY14_08005 [Brachybacterium sp. EF45031]|uniref:hypothetical protein n=1 Tax=Brachybacterium sillae TaxID=2810536 RepID=UPI00217CE893|nr:hypothetical protein [Brachybacterium sillae]MCS6711964.1 hypothetical protein [Brachybacterium sillae]